MKRFLLKFLMLGFVLFSTFSYAQVDVSGVVTDDQNEPLIGVSIVVKGTALGTVSDYDGSYSITVPSEGSILEFLYIGYKSEERQIDGSTSELNIVLSEDVNNLDEVVITGLATTVKRKNLANSVARVDAQELTGVAAQATLDGALYGKFKGAEIRANSGAPGGGMSFKLRGLTSISGSSQPLIILDGVYIDNSSIPAGLNVVSKASGGGSSSNQDNPSNRLADIDPNDIESVEILKGASAAAIYGSRASGGVVIINTKKGKAGETKVSFAQSIGQSSQLKKLGVRKWTEERVLASRFTGSIDQFRNNPVTNYEDLLYGNKGLLSNTRLSVSGGSDKTTFFIGGSYKNEEGIVKNTGYEKISGRFNLDHQINKIFDVSLTTAYINSSADRGFFNNDNSGTTMGVAFTSTPSFAVLEPDANGNYPANPFAASNFLETRDKITNNERVNRFIGGVNLTTKIFTSDKQTLKLVTRAGLDFYNLNTTALFPNTVQFQRDGNGLNGVSVQGMTKNMNTNIASFLVHNYYMDDFSFATTVGLTAEKFNRNTILGVANNMIGSQTNLDQSGARDISQSRLIQQDKGFFVQEEINYKDMVLMTIGLRGDKSSNNGDVNKLYYYPKANLALNFHEMPFWNEESSITQAKLRVAYGEAGNFARFGSKYTTLGSSIINGKPAVSIPGLLGNETVGPERQREIEVGADLEFNNMISFDGTYYVKSVDDLLLNAAIQPSSGFNSRVTNAAALENRGFELGLNMALLKSEDVNWNSRLSFWKNKSKVTRLDVPAFTTGGFADFLGQYLIKEGYSPTTVVGTGRNPNVTLNGDGAPNLQILGNAEPDFQMSWSNNISYKNFDFSFLFHWKKGGENINLSALLFDLNDTTHDYDDTTLDPEGKLSNGDYRKSLLGSSAEPFVEDAGYLRLREVGVYYTLPKALSYTEKVRIGFSGNNLINIFDYNSYDPEVSNFGGNGLSSGVEVTPFPSAKRWDFHVRVDF